MAIDFRLTSHQRALQLESRKFAADLANLRPAHVHFDRDVYTKRAMYRSDRRAIRALRSCDGCARTVLIFMLGPLGRDYLGEPTGLFGVPAAVRQGRRTHVPSAGLAIHERSRIGW